MESDNFFKLSHAESRLWQSDSSTSQWKPVCPPSLAEHSLMNRFRSADCHSEMAPIFDRHHFRTIIDMSSESLSTSVRNGYRHRPESARKERVTI